MERRRGPQRFRKGLRALHGYTAKLQVEVVNQSGVSWRGTASMESSALRNCRVPWTWGIPWCLTGRSLALPGRSCRVFHAEHQVFLEPLCTVDGGDPRSAQRVQWVEQIGTQLQQRLVHKRSCNRVHNLRSGRHVQPCTQNADSTKYTLPTSRHGTHIAHTRDVVTGDIQDRRQQDGALSLCNVVRPPTTQVVRGYEG